MKVALLLMHLQFPGSDSLKAKRKRLKPLLVRLHKEFNVSAAELDMQDEWENAVIGCSLVSTEAGAAESQLHKVATWVERHWHDVDLIEDRIEIL
jgi:uncharacterized protein YlxP (DUF503 family)